MTPLLVAFRLALAEGIGPRQVKRLLDVFGDLETFLRRAPAGGEWDALIAAATRPVADEARRLAEWHRGQRPIGLFCPDFPAGLRELADPPIMIHVRGRPPAAWPEPRVVLVGTRRPSPYGIQMADRLAGGLAAGGAAVGSGLALGVDGAAHRAALAAGGFTFAVVGGGTDVPAPSRHADLHAEIAERGAIVSEFPPGTGVQAWHFPARNRILAALADVVVVVEGRAKSGSLITADLALEIGREVMAVPGRVGDPQAEAPLGLLARGAAPALDEHSVLATAGWVSRAVAEAPTHPAVPDRYRSLLDMIPVAGTIHVDDLVRRTGQAVPDLMSELLELELLGWVRAWPGKHYGRSLPAGRI